MTCLPCSGMGVTIAHGPIWALVRAVLSGFAKGMGKQRFGVIRGPNGTGLSPNTVRKKVLTENQRRINTILTCARAKNVVYYGP